MHLLLSPPLETGRASRLMLPPHQLGLREGAGGRGAMVRCDNLRSGEATPCCREQVSPESNRAHSRSNQLFHPKLTRCSHHHAECSSGWSEGAAPPGRASLPPLPTQINHPAENQRLHAKINGSTDVGQGSFFPDGVQVLDRGSLGKRWEERQLVVCGSGSVWERSASRGKELTLGTDCAPAPRPIYKQHPFPVHAPDAVGRPPLLFLILLPKRLSLTLPSQIPICFRLQPLPSSFNISASFTLTRIAFTHTRHALAPVTSRRNGSRYHRRSQEGCLQAQGQPCHLPGWFILALTYYYYFSCFI